MGKPRALDLFCKAGGATKGLQRAGFHVTGVDIEPQPRYCGDRFIQVDIAARPSFENLPWLDDFDFIWASPPCQAYSIAAASQRNAGKEYPDLVALIRSWLQESRIPFVIENVPGAPLRRDLVLCGSNFGLKTVRHRIFEFSWPIGVLVPACAHDPGALSIVGRGTTSWNRAKNGGKCHSILEYRNAMDIHWMNRGELSQAIPPAYAEFIGKQALVHIEREWEEVCV